jgi:DNA-binding NarL/FixJ family response regulator
MAARTRLLLADDHLETTALLRELLQPEFEVLANVTDGQTLVEYAARLAPDVIVSDIGMPALDGIAAAKAILRAMPSARIVFVTVHNDRSLAARALATGALGYVLKLSAGDDLIPAIRAAERGQTFVCPALRLEPGLVQQS